ncbi:dTMP kinase [Vannielia litorea]|uniref:dTMP kinase n=1 Tax=Vannielia litorea TaxID=1217970 RepID=UPI001C94DFB2|nr:dTMP kinase [Vannielia litorea]MBY6047893.1 dTMP kinase [Vannielia litorea]MBY6075307.1 dTMP kinase [Vannielia litorea]
MTQPHGFFITLEGIDGAGKSTQARALGAWAESEGREVVLTREPGGSAGAEEIRRLLVEGAPDRWSGETETLLFTAARRDHLERVITPALAAGKVVISDRFADSTRVYQGAARGELREFVDALHALAIGREPDLTLILDMDPEVALARGLARASGEDRFEEEGLAFQQKLRAGFLALAEANPARCRLIDAGRPAEAITADVITAVREHMR